MLALFSFGSAKLGTIMRLAVSGAVGLGVVGIGGSVSADPPDGNGNHHHGGGDDGDVDIIAPDAVADLLASSAAMGTISLLLQRRLVMAYPVDTRAILRS